MADKETERQQKQPQVGDAAQKGAQDKFLADAGLTKYVGNSAQSQSSNELGGMTSSAAGRVLYVTGEGLAKSPMAAWDAMTHTTGSDLLKTAGTGALFGLGMRVLLPETGAMKALVGTAMSYFFIKDAAQPILSGWKDAAGAKDLAELHAASDHMAGGLGHFAWNSAVGMGSGMLADGAAGLVLKNTVRGRQFEAWKDRQFNSEETAAGRFFKWSERTADNTSDAVSDKLLGRRRGALADDLSLAEKLEAIKQASKHGVAENGGVQSEKLDLETILSHRKRYRDTDFTTKIDNLLDGTQHAEVTPVVKPELTTNIRMRMLNDQKPPVGDNPPPNTGGADPIIITDAAAKVTPPRPTGDVNNANVGDMAVAMRKLTGAVTKEDIAVAQAKEDIAGPVSSTMRSGTAPLDQGHFSNNELLLKLNDEIKTADDYRSAGMLLDHFRTANNQLEIAARGNKGGLNAITDLNQYSRSIHALMLKALDDNGVPRSVVRGSNSPLFTIRDSDGAGPYTIPAIKDPRTGKAVTDAAVVTYPREYQGMEGVHTSGVYAHELGHDLIYGDLLRFPTEARDNILTTKIVGNAMKANGIADVDVQVPGAPGGVMKKSELFVQLLKAQANENTADMFGTSVDPHTGLSLATLLGSLRKPGTENPNGPGLLETRSMYGKDMIDTDMGNTLGVEPHGIDRWRIKLSAQVLRELAGKDPNAQPVHAYADKLDGLADSMARPGNQYVWAHADKKGEFIAVNAKEFDAIIPALVDAQFNTPLASLQGKTLKHIAPNTVERFTKVETLADQMAEAAGKGQTTIPTFDKNGYRIEEVFSAGLSGWMKAVQKNAEGGGSMSAEGTMARINKISENLRAQYRNDAPESILSSGPQVQPITSRIGNLAFVRPVGIIGRWAGHMAEGQPRLRERFADWTPRLGGYVGATRFAPMFSDMANTKAVENQVLNNQQDQKQQEGERR
jgi:hypothetical protein